MKKDKRSSTAILYSFVRAISYTFKVEYLGKDKFIIPGDPNIIVFINSNKNIKWYTVGKNIYAGGVIKQGDNPIYHPKETLVKFLTTNAKRKVINT